jgi:hypothetical protein
MTAGDDHPLRTLQAISSEFFRPRYLDILHDMGPSELFIVDGESLLLEIWENTRAQSR